jgi:broad specificity phosphatase PhoE
VLEEPVSWLDWAVTDGPNLLWQSGITASTKAFVPTTSPKSGLGWNIFRDGCPNGESPEQIVGRADQLIARLDALDGNVALFSHGHFSRVLAVRWIGLSVIDGQLFSLGTGSLSILQHDPRHPERRVIALWNAQPAALGHAN